MEENCEKGEWKIRRKNLTTSEYSYRKRFEVLPENAAECVRAVAFKRVFYIKIKNKEK